MSNEAAERLHDALAHFLNRGVRIQMIDEALAAEYERGKSDGMTEEGFNCHLHVEAERRATVERIRERWNGTNGRMRLDAILDEEAAR